MRAERARRDTPAAERHNVSHCVDSLGKMITDEHTIHRNQEARKYLRDRGITVYILTPSSSELNPIEKCKCNIEIH